jgi:hypothetical protein
VRDGEALRRIGVSAELFDDHTPLALGVSGRLSGEAFTLVGRLQYGYADGTWNEWHALFDNGRSGWLSEDNGAYVFAFDAATPADTPQPDALRAGQAVRVGAREWNVASVVRAHLVAAQGELPRPPRLEGDFLVADLRSTQGDVATIDASGAELQWSVGRSVLLSALGLQGLREVSEKTLGSRGVECPSCGAALEPKLSTTQSLSCPQCNAVVDISKGVGAELAHYAQNNSGAGGLEPQIPLGTTGTFAFGDAEARWQLVGYLERCDLPAPGSDDEQTFWREYLLYEPKQGFVFLVDAEDGWSWVRPITGVPSGKGDRVSWSGKTYQRTYGYDAKVTWVQGEFYWRVRREERAHVDDYVGSGAASNQRLSREETRSGGGQEVTWSAGETMSAAEVADGFALPPAQRAALSRDVAPVSGSSGGKGLSWKAVVLLILVVIIVSALAECSGDRCDDVRASFGTDSAEYQQCVASRGSGSRTGGGSFGGYSSGGGHK